MAYSTATAYQQELLTTYNNITMIDQLITQPMRKIVTKSERGASAVFNVHKMNKGSVTALTAGAAAGTDGAATVYAISIAANEYGKGTASLDDGGVRVNKSLIDLQSAFDDNWAGYLKGEAHKGITALEALAATQMITSIGGGTDAAFVHAMGPDSGGTQFTAPTTYGFVRYGTQATTRAARADIPVGDVMTYSWMLRLKSNLLSRYAPPLLYSASGEPLYGMMCHPHVLSDLKASSGLNAFTDVSKYLDQGMLIKRGLNVGMAGVLEGVLLFANPEFKYAGEGSDAIDIFPVVMMGSDFLGKVYAPATELPPISGNGSSFDLPEGVRVYAEPFGPPHGGRLTVLSWYAYAGYGIVNPYGAVRLEVASATAAAGM
jgi:hypothetical protein